MKSNEKGRTQHVVSAFFILSYCYEQNTILPKWLGLNKFGKKTAPVNIIWFSVISGCLNIPNTLEKDEIP